MSYKDLSKDQLESLKQDLEKQYDEFKSRNLKLDMSRGKPSCEQLDLSTGLCDCVDYETYSKNGGIDCRNYGCIDGLPEVRQMFADMLGVSADDVILGGNSSLNVMFDCISQGYTHGFSDIPWCKQDNIKFLCPSPGYDRHFCVTEYFGFELITVKMTETGPDMDQIEQLVKDPSVKGIWCVPKYSNPTGITYSDETVRRFAALKPAAKDFRIFWDNAYAVHDLYDDRKDTLLNLAEECKKNGNEDIYLMFASTSKIAYPGSGVSAVACSPNNKKILLSRLKYQTIGPDKMNQLGHLCFFKNTQGILNHMKLHASKLRPRFEVVLNHLKNDLDEDIVSYTAPNGGYFVSVDLNYGCAKEVVALCEQAGVKLTDAGATYPYGKDPENKNIRLSPSFPPVEELDLAMQLFTLCSKLATVNKLLEA